MAESMFSMAHFLENLKSAYVCFKIASSEKKLSIVYQNSSFVMNGTPMLVEKFRQIFFEHTDFIPKEINIGTEGGNYLAEILARHDDLVYVRFLPEQTKSGTDIVAAYKGEMFELLYETLPDTVYFKNADGKKILLNNADAKYMGFNSSEEAVGKTDFDVYPADIAQAFWEDDKSIIDTGTPVINREEKIIGEDHQEHWLLTTKLPMKDRNNNVIGIMGIGRDITQIKKTQEMLQKREEQLNDLVRQLKELNAQKDKFFSIIAHDLRGPFTSMLGFVTFLIEDFTQMSDAQKLADLESIHIMLENLLSFIDNLLTWARLQMNRVEIIPSKVKLCQLVERALESQGIVAERKNVSFDISYDREVICFVDHFSIETVIRNLISNAIKFSNKGGRIDIRCQSDDNMVTVSVIDHGVGMSSWTVNNLFHTEANVKREGTEKEKGTGLGLHICKEFIERNGGSIHVASKENQGTTISFRIPLYKE